MSKKTSTAALEFFPQGSLHSQCRVPCRPAGAGNTGARRSKERNTEREQGIQQTQLAIYQEDVMDSGNRLTAILPAILRITLGLILWTLGAATMNLTAAQTRVKEHRVVQNFAIDRAAIENLQRWVNAGHDPWCLDSQLVAASTLRRISPDFSNYELASLPRELEHNQKTRSIYAFHSLDGRTTYRIVLHRYRGLRPTAGSLSQMIWVPESAEIITRDTPD